MSIIEGIPYMNVRQTNLCSSINSEHVDTGLGFDLLPVFHLL